MHHAREARIELHDIVIDLQLLRSRVAQVQDDLALLHVGTRYFAARALRIDDHVRSVAAVRNPLMHRAQQVGALGRGFEHRSPTHTRISRSRSDSESRNAARAKTWLAYLRIGCAFGGSSTS